MKSDFRTVLASTALVSMAAVMNAGTAQAQGAAQAAAQSGTQQFDIPAQSLASALMRFSRETRLELFYSAELAQGKTTRGVSGKMAPAEALSRLLAGTGLTFKFSNPTTITLEPAPQAAADAIQLGPVRVEGGEQGVPTSTRLGAAFSPATTEATNSYTTRAATMGKDEQPLKDIPQSVTVLTRKKMNDQNIVNLQQAVESVTGISITRAPGMGFYIYSRGFEINTFLYDGVPMLRNSYTTGSFVQESMAFYDRMEVLRGAGGLMQGARGPGGAINFVRKRGQDEFQVNLTGTAGSWNHFASQVDVGGPVDLDGRLRVRAVADYDRTDSFIDYVGSKTLSLYLAADYDLGPDTLLGAGIAYKRTRATPFERGLPRYTDGSEIDFDRSTYGGASWNRAANDQTTYFADIEHKFSDDWSIKVAANYMTEDNSSNYQFITGAISKETLTGSAYYYFAVDYRKKGRSIDAHVNGRFDLAGMRNEVVFGADYMRHTTNDAYGRHFNTGAADVFNIDHNLPEQTLASLTATQFSSLSSFDVKQGGVYGTWRAHPTDALTLIAGGRLSWYDYTYDSRTGTAAVYGALSHTTLDTKGKFTPFAGMLYALNPSWNLYASYATIFEPQSGRTVSGTLLDPITGTNYEAGIKGELADGRANVSLALFRYDHTGRSVNDYDNGLVCDGWYCARSSGKVRSEGIEAEASGQVLPGLEVSAGYTYNTTKYRADPQLQGKVFSLWTPKHLLRVWGTYTLSGRLDRVSLGLGMNMQDKTIGSDRTFKVDGFTVFNARLGFKVSEATSLAVNVDNIFDKTYYVPGYNQTASYNYYGNPRNFLVTARHRF
ncbi:MAG: TonB-dependent siderophore receptor [Novosphingobium sp.]